MENNTSCIESLSKFPCQVPIGIDPFYALAEILCSILAIGGNFVVLYVYARHRSLRALAKNAYVVSLAVADLLVGLVGIPSALSTSVGLPQHFESCLVMNSVLLLLCTASIMSLLAVTVDRLWAIRHPFKYSKVMTPGRACCAIALCWTVATSIGLLPVLGWNKGRPPVPRCFFVEVIDGRYLVFICFGTIVAPSVVMAIMYTTIYRSVASQVASYIICTYILVCKGGATNFKVGVNAL